MSIGEKIKQQREHKGYTQEEVAKRVGVSKQYIGQIENGLKVPPLSIVIGIADMFHCSIDGLVGRNVS